MKRLTAKTVASVTAPGKYGDGDAGLFLLVKPSGSKSYVQRLTIHGRRHDIGLGSAKWTMPSEARAMAQTNRKIARMGGDPCAGRRAAVPTFAEAANIVIALHAANWRYAGKSEKQWRGSLRDYALPRLGRKTVAEITTADVLATLSPIWNEKRETARRVRQRISAIMAWSVAQGHRADNPAGDAIAAALPRNGATRRRQPALPHGEIAGAIEKVRASQAWPTTRLAFELVILAACRSGEVRRARWDEIDLDTATWTVPGARTKSGRQHRVPLAPRAMEIVAEARQYRDESGLVFPSVTGRALLDSALSNLARETNMGAVPHGFRSSFRDWAGETGVAREVAEACLAHVVKGVEGAYARSDLLDRRRPVMDRWADYVTSRAPAKVVNLHRG